MLAVALVTRHGQNDAVSHKRVRRYIHTSAERAVPAAVADEHETRELLHTFSGMWGLSETPDLSRLFVDATDDAIPEFLSMTFCLA